MCNSPESSIGSSFVIKAAKLLTLILLAEPLLGFGQQESSPNLAALVATAQKSQSSGDYAAAATAYLAAAQLQPAIPELWANLGLMQQESADLNAAIQSFQHAMRLNPSLYVPNLFLGVDYVRTGKAREAIPMLRKAEHIRANDPQAALALGRAYIALGQFTEASNALEKAVHLDPKLSSAWFALGIAYLDSVEIAARRMTAEPDSAFAQALYAESLEQQFRFREASDIFQKILASDPQPPCMRSELGYALLRQHNSTDALSSFVQENGDHPECALSLLGRARIAIESGEDKSALSLLANLWSRDHGYLSSNIHLLIEGLPAEPQSTFAVSVRDVDGTIDPQLSELLRRSIDGSSDETDVSSDQSANLPQSKNELHSIEKDYAAGQFRSCAEGLRSSSKDTAALATACAFFTGNYESASAGASALLQKPPHSVLALYWLIKADERLAFQCLAQFQRLEPDSTRSHVLLGDIYRQRERYDDAIAEYKKALTNAPNDAASLLGLASAELGDNNVIEAAKVAGAALAVAPDDPEINLVMAEALIDNHEYARAEPFLVKSRNVKPQMLPHVHALLGRMYAETSDIPKAVAELKLGEPSDVDGSVHYQLARLYRQIGNSRGAEEELQMTKDMKQRRRDQKLIAVDDPDDPISPPKP